MYGTLVLIFALVGQRILPVENAKILSVETIAGKSHWNFMSAVLRSLTDAGHVVTVFTPFPDGDRENYTEVDMSKSFPNKVGLDVVEMIETFGNSFKLMETIVPLLRNYYCDAVYGNGEFDKILRNNGEFDFDVIIMEPVASDCMSHLATILQIPIIYVIPSPMITFMERTFTGHLSNPSCVSNIFGHFAVPKTFDQRFINSLQLFYGLFITAYHEVKQKIIYPKSYDESPRVNPSIIFQNSYYNTEVARPVTPNLIDIGGIHLKAAKGIPKDILDFIEKSPNGVIYFTFGSTIKMTSLPDRVQNAFKEALAQVPQRVLWKYEGEMKDKPNNVMIRNWFPQRDILLHPEVKLFISHGGMSGVYEAVDAGVPVLGFPLFYDQPRNIEHLVHAGMAISMDLLTVTKNKLLNGILEMTNNEKYMNNAKIASGIFKDRPMTPEQLVVYWTEYVIRHKGAPHLKSHGVNLTWYQYILLDVIAVMSISICLVLFTCYKVLKFIYKITLKNVHDYNEVKVQ